MAQLLSVRRRARSRNARWLRRGGDVRRRAVALAAAVAGARFVIAGADANEETGDGAAVLRTEYQRNCGAAEKCPCSKNGMTHIS